MATALASSAALCSTRAFVRAAAKPRQQGAARLATIVRAQQVKDPAAPNADVVPKDVLEYAKTLPGISEPFPNIFDPLNFLANASVQDLRRWRESEVTHGRVCMLAALGIITQENLPDQFGPFPHVVGPAINHFQQVEAKGAIFWEPLVFAIGLAEAYRVGLGWDFPKSSTFNQLRDDYEMGNLNFDPLGLCPTNPKERYDMQTKELNNGRLAMVAVAAFVAQELVEEVPIFERLFPRVVEEVERLN